MFPCLDPTPGGVDSDGDGLGDGFEELLAARMTEPLRSPIPTMTASRTTSTTFPTTQPADEGIQGPIETELRDIGEIVEFDTLDASQTFDRQRPDSQAGRQSSNLQPTQQWRGESRRQPGNIAGCYATSSRSILGKVDGEPNPVGLDAVRFCRATKDAIEDRDSRSRYLCWSPCSKETPGFHPNERQTSPPARLGKHCQSRRGRLFSVHSDHERPGTAV